MFKPKEGLILNVWSVAAGDPVGKHKIKVYVSDKLVKEFDFVIVKAKK